MTKITIRMGNEITRMPSPNEVAQMKRKQKVDTILGGIVLALAFVCCVYMTTISDMFAQAYFWHSQHATAAGL